MNDNNFDFHFNKDNLISYFYAFSACRMIDKRNEVLEKLLQDLTDENIIYFLKVVSTLDDDYLNSYSFWLIRHLINKNEKLPSLEYYNFKFDNIAKLNTGTFTFDANRIIYNSNKFTNLGVNINFLKKHLSNYIEEREKYFKCNEYFNLGRIVRKRSEENIMDDYPHYFQMVLENDPNIILFAKRPSENGNFIISRNIVYCVNPG